MPATLDDRETLLPKETIEPDQDEEMDEADQDENRSTIARCYRCHADLGEFYNSWVKVTGSYYLPAMQGSYRIVGLQRQKAPTKASANSSLDGCVLQPLSCSGCSDTLGISVVEAPAGKRAYVNRELFKLPKIQLKSDVTEEDVDAIIEDDGEQAARSRTEPPAAVPSTSTASLDRAQAAPSATPKPKSMAALVHPAAPVANMDRRDEVRLPDAASPRLAQGQRPIATKRESGDRMIDSQTPPAGQSHPQRTSAPQRENSGPLQTSRPVEREVRPYAHSHMNGHAVSQSVPPSAIEVKLDALDRLQTQVNLNRATLETQAKEMHSLRDMVSLVREDLRTLWQAVEGITNELRTRPQQGASHGAGERVDDTLDLFAQQIAETQRKVSEVDQLKMQVELLKRRLTRSALSDSPATAGPTPYTAQREAAMHHTPVQQVIHQVPQISAPRPPQPQQHPAYSQPYTPESAHAHPAAVEPETAASGWVSVNTNKRPFANGVDGRSEAVETPIGSPKRQKLAPLEPRHSYDAAMHATQPARLERMETDGSNHRSHESPHHYADSTNPATFIPYTSGQDTPPDEIWRQDPSRIVSHSIDGKSPRGRGRGRGGRPRKSLPTDGVLHHPTNNHTLDYERGQAGWGDANQLSPDTFYATPGGSRRTSFAARRPSIGNPGVGPLQHGRVPIPASQALPTVIGLPNDPYAHTKKTRTKPIRNADGVLIRKDGRPDMRSQSSAANLRKVHARKEEERRVDSIDGLPGSGGPGHSGLSTVESSAAQSVASDSPMSAHAEPVSHDTSHDSSERSAPPRADGATDNAEKNMQHMIPRGADEPRDRYFSGERYFGSENDAPSSRRTEPAEKGAEDTRNDSASAPAERPYRPAQEAEISPGSKDEAVVGAERAQQAQQAAAASPVVATAPTAEAIPAS